MIPRSGPKIWDQNLVPQSGARLWLQNVTHYVLPESDTGSKYQNPVTGSQWLEMWESGNLRFWKPGNLTIWGFGKSGIWKFENLEI